MTLWRDLKILIDILLARDSTDGTTDSYVEGADAPIRLSNRRRGQEHIRILPDGSVRRVRVVRKPR